MFACSPFVNCCQWLSLVIISTNPMWWNLAIDSRLSFFFISRKPYFYLPLQRCNEHSLRQISLIKSCSISIDFDEVRNVCLIPKKYFEVIPSFFHIKIFRILYVQVCIFKSCINMRKMIMYMYIIIHWCLIMMPSFLFL